MMMMTYAYFWIHLDCNSLNNYKCKKLLAKLVEKNETQVSCPVHCFCSYMILKVIKKRKYYAVSCNLRTIRLILIRFARAWAVVSGDLHLFKYSSAIPN